MRGNQEEATLGPVVVTRGQVEVVSGCAVIPQEAADMSHLTTDQGLIEQG